MSTAIHYDTTNLHHCFFRRKSEINGLQAVVYNCFVCDEPGLGILISVYQ